MQNLNWYPGHMTKARRMMQEQLGLVDLLIELADARVPAGSRNPDIAELCGSKPRILVLNKADLADPVRTERYASALREAGQPVLIMDARTRKDTGGVRRAMEEACRAKIERDRRRGILNRPLRAMAVGIPNVGKSTLINTLAGRGSAKVGNRPGVTKGKQWISLGGTMQLLDTPGILWPRFEDPRIGVRLALIGSISDDILDIGELASQLIRYLTAEYPGIMGKRYSGENICFPVIEGEDQTAHLRAVAAVRNLWKKGQEPDLARAAALIIDDFRSGRLGRISLEDGRL